MDDWNRWQAQVKTQKKARAKLASSHRIEELRNSKLSQLDTFDLQRLLWQFSFQSLESKVVRQKLDDCKVNLDFWMLVWGSYISSGSVQRASFGDQVNSMVEAVTYLTVANMNRM